MNSPPRLLSVEENGLPTALVVRRCWAVWEQRWNPHRQCWTKPPLKPIDDGYSPYASPSNLQHRWPLNLCLNLVRKHGADGVGLMVGDGLAAIDLDHCFDADGDLKLWAYQLVHGLNTYTERSPSGHGLHLVAFCRTPLDNRDLNVAGGGKIQFFGQNHFCTVTGHVEARWCADAYDVQDRTLELMVWYGETWPAPASPATNVFSSTERGGSDEELLGVMFISRQGERIRRLWRGEMGGYPSHSEADLALMNHLAFWCNRDPGRMQRLFEASGLHRPGEKAASYVPNLIRKAIGRTTNGYQPSAIDRAAVAAAAEAVGRSASS
jgi:primase-polymerase (primpol)-like protein